VGGCLILFLWLVVGGDTRCLRRRGAVFGVGGWMSCGFCWFRISNLRRFLVFGWGFSWSGRTEISGLEGSFFRSLRGFWGSFLGVQCGLWVC